MKLLSLRELLSIGLNISTLRMFDFVPITISLRTHPITFWIGFTLCLCGGLLRAIGEIQLGSNFAHQIEVHKSDSHELITTGLYS